MPVARDSETMRAMPIRRPRALAACAVLLLVLAAGRSRAADPPREAPITYRLVLDEVLHRTLTVEVTVPDVAGALDIIVSRSSPGRYALHDFAKNVFDVSATDGAGRALVLEHPDTNRWRAEGHDGTVRLRYRVFGDRVDGTYLAVGPTHAHVNPPAALAWFAGLELRPVLVSIVPPAGSGWQVATQLFPTGDPLTWSAPNLQYLMDSPLEVSRFLWRTFEADLPAGATTMVRPTIGVALHHFGGAEDLDALIERLRRVVRVEAAVFGEYPAYDNGRYTFLVDYLPWAAADGMEHRNSTVITGSAGPAMLQREAVVAAAHEFFHGWNVERIRPRSLEPFDFDRPNVSGELWLAEGLTSYYEDVALARAGLAPLDETLRSVGSAVNTVSSSPALGFRSAVDMSRLAPLVDGAQPIDRTNWPSTYISYYVHGHALGVGLDLAIREHTAGARSLDDFMRAMWRMHGRPGGTRPGYVDAPYTMADVRARLAEVTADRAFADGLVTRFIEGHELMDYPRLLSLAGLVLRRARPGVPSLGVTTLQPNANRLHLASQPPMNSPLYLAGLGEDDEIVAINGRGITGLDSIDRALQRLAPGATVPLTFMRRGEQREQSTMVTLVEDPALELLPLEKIGRAPDERQKRVRESWLGVRAP